MKITTIYLLSTLLKNIASSPVFHEYNDAAINTFTCKHVPLHSNSSLNYAAFLSYYLITLQNVGSIYSLLK